MLGPSILMYMEWREIKKGRGREKGHSLSQTYTPISLNEGKRQISTFSHVRTFPQVIPWQIFMFLHFEAMSGILHDEEGPKRSTLQIYHAYKNMSMLSLSKNSIVTHSVMFF